MTTLTFENEFGAVTIKVHKDDMDVTGVINELFVPALNGAGYVIYPNSIVELKEGEVE